MHPGPNGPLKAREGAATGCYGLQEDRCEFRILGPTEVLDGGKRVPIPAGRGRALLAILVLHAGDPVSADRLIDELWGESPPPTARTVVHGLISKLRYVLEPNRGKTRSGTPSKRFDAATSPEMQQRRDNPSELIRSMSYSSVDASVWQPHPLGAPST